MDWRKFQERARKVMSQHFGVELTEKRPEGSPKKFDMVSPNEDIVGDAKYLTLVRRKKLPSAKFMDIAGHVWLLQALKEANKRFLVFGNQRKVPEQWLEKYGELTENVEFYFINYKSCIERLEKTR